MTGAEIFRYVFWGILLLCIAFSVMRRLWVALGALAVSVAGNVYFSFVSPNLGLALAFSLVGVLLVFPILVIVGNSRREREERREKIRAVRRQTGRPVPRKRRR
jgi:hypothetical protein